MDHDFVQGNPELRKGTEPLPIPCSMSAVQQDHMVGILQLDAPVLAAIERVVFG